MKRWGRGILVTRAALRAMACLMALGALAWSPAIAHGADYGFAATYVDSQLAGGEPTVMADPVHGTIIYTSHEGTTHLYRNGLVTPFDFGSNYRNQVNVWTSTDNGVSWF